MKGGKQSKLRFILKFFFFFFFIAKTRIQKSAPGSSLSFKDYFCRLPVARWEKRAGQEAGYGLNFHL